jgi:hypothetical protein
MSQQNKSRLNYIAIEQEKTELYRNRTTADNYISIKQEQTTISQQNNSRLNYISIEQEQTEIYRNRTTAYWNISQQNNSRLNSNTIPHLYFFNYRLQIFTHAKASISAYKINDLCWLYILCIFLQWWPTGLQCISGNLPLLILMCVCVRACARAQIYKVPLIWEVHEWVTLLYQSEAQETAKH